MNVIRKGFIVLYFLYVLFEGADSKNTERWMQPLDRPLEIVAPFNKPATHYSSGHRGFDLAATKGEIVLAPTNGQVVFVGKVVDRSLITIETESGYLISIEPIVSQSELGEYVSRGDVIGVVDSGAHCSEKCIHLGVRQDDEYLNPLRFFVDKPRLLPLL